MIHIDLTGVELKLKQENNTTKVFDRFRKKWLVLTPEEHIRQVLAAHLIDTNGYPAGMMAVEKKIMVGNMPKRFDLVVFDREHKPWMLIECKAPEVAITEQTLHQLLNYHRSVPCRYWVLCNGHQTFCADAGNVEDVRWLSALPAYDL